MPSPAGDRVAAALSSRAGPDASASSVAASVVELCRDLERSLTPIVGARGFAALYGRSQYLTNRNFPWIGQPPDGVPTAADLDALRSVLAAQNAATGMRGGMALLEAFHSLLVSMLGAALTERLLADVLLPHSSGHAAQDLNR